MARDWELVNKVLNEIEKVISRGNVILLVKNEINNLSDDKLDKELNNIINELKWESMSP